MQKLKNSLKKSGGRNNTGSTMVFTKSGGTKKKYRFIDFKRNLYEFGFVKRIELDPNRSSYLALVCYPCGALSYIIATENMKIGYKIFNLATALNNSTINGFDSVYNSNLIENQNNLINGKKINKTIINMNSGNVFSLNNLPNGVLVNNIELYPNAGALFSRAAGTNAQIIKQYNERYTQIKLKSGEHRIIFSKCTAVLGTVSNLYHNQKKLNKAGDSRHLGVKPQTRGRAMNPVDHPHGGRTNGGIQPRTPWGKYTKNVSTRSTRKNNYFIIVKKNKI